MSNQDTLAISDHLVIVRRVDNPNSFARQFQEVGRKQNMANGKTIESTPTPYGESVFPMSRDTFRPEWSKSEGVRLFDIPEIGSSTSREKFSVIAEKVNATIKECKLTYPDGPRQGQFIEEASLTSDSDPFFAHNDLEKTHMEGDLTLDLSKPLDKILYWAMRASDSYAMKGHIDDKAIPSRVQYIMFSAKEDVNEGLEVASEERALYRKIDTMDRTELMMICNIFRIEFRDDTNDDMLRDLISVTIRDPKKIVAGLGFNYKEWLKILLRDGSETLQIKEIVYLAYHRGIISKTKTGFMFQGDNLGNTLIAVEMTLLTPAKRDVVLSLQTLLKGKAAGGEFK